MKRKLFISWLAIVWLALAATCWGQTQTERARPAVFTHATVAVMVAKPAPPESIHQTVGYATAGVGAGTYIYHRTGRPTADGGFYHNGPQADDYYELVDKREANSLQFGATCDSGNTDDIVPLQACVDAGNLHDVPIHFQSRQNGDYDISAPLFVTGTTSKTSAAGFYTAQVRGDGVGSSALTKITPTFTDRPALCIQMARGVTIKDLAIIGTNDAPATAGAIADGTYANWVDVGHRNSQYSPQCGIAIDPTLGTTPADGGYPSMTYIGNTASGSNQIKLLRLSIRGHVVGVISRPDGQSNQVDQYSIDDCEIGSCATVLAVCNSQTRSCSVVTKLDVDDAHTVIDCVRYGQGVGICPSVFGAQFNDCFRILRIPTAPGNACLAGISAEELREIGICGAGTSATKGTVTFLNCDLSIKHSDGMRSPFIISAFMPVTFNGVHFRTSGDAIAGAGALFNFQGPHLDFIGCTFMNAVTPKHIAVSSDSNSLPTFRNCLKRDATNARLVGLPRGGTALNIPSARLEPDRSERFAVTQAGIQLYTPGREATYVSDNTSGASLVGTTLTFTATDGTIYQVGDFIHGTIISNDATTSSLAPACIVTAVAGNNITAEVIFNLSNVTTLTTSCRIFVPEWAPAQSLTGTTTSGSPTIASVSPTTIIAAGDWITGDYGIAGNSRVVSINTGAATVTLNKNATASGSTHLYWGKISNLEGVPSFASAAVTASVDPGTRIPVGVKHVTITSTDTNHIVVLPPPVVGTEIQGYVGANGCEFYSSGSSIRINNVICSATNEAAMPANSKWKAKCVDPFFWILTYETLAGAAGATITPDAR